MVELLFADDSYRIRGACFEVYREEGCGFVELVQQQCLEVEFQCVGIPYAAHPRFGLECKGRPLGLLVNFGRHPQVENERVIRERR